MLAILALGAAQRIINQVIDLDSITRQNLNQLQGQLLRVNIASPMLSVDVYFDENKIRLEPTPTGHSERVSIFEQRPFDDSQKIQSANATLNLDTAVQGLALLKMSDDEFKNIPLEGDYQLLFKLQSILKQSHFDLASTLSPWVGVNVANQLARVQELPKAAMKSAKSAEFIITDSLQNESGLLASQWQMNELQQELLLLNQRIDRLDAQLEQALQTQTAQGQ
ncbi:MULTISPECIES: hypothetical protein [unclassified Acinetobacter]|uniref:hypothetical protein n=1 Tax=unclassified Acinetobacter TaxID=196816 RepID=UPI0035B79475